MITSLKHYIYRKTLECIDAHGYINVKVKIKYLELEEFKVTHPILCGNLLF